MICSLIYLYVLTSMNIEYSYQNSCPTPIPRISVINIPQNYSRLLPSRHETPIHVAIGFIVHDILEVEDHSHTIKLKMKIPLYWNDSRIILNSEYKISPEMVDVGKWYDLELSYQKILWFPNLLISNLKEFKTLSSFDKAEKFMVYLGTSSPMRFYYEGNHLVSFTCPMAFDDFPFDTHNCLFEVYLDSPKSEQEILYHGGNSSYWGRSNTSTILKYSTDFFPFPKDKKHRIEQYTNDFEVKQSVAGFKITFRRKPEVYIFDYYIPSGIFVVVSWVSLVIPPDAPPGRIALIITTFLVLVNIANSVFSKSPRAHSINPIQVWILSCIVFVFITVLEYAVVLFIIRRQRKYVLDLKKKKQKTKRNNSKVSHSELSIMEEKPKISAVTNEVALGVLTTNIDHASVWILMSLFILFNIVYWSIYS